ncbi:MAG: hypothetical protein ACE5OR_14045, partial [bacterium]
MRQARGFVERLRLRCWIRLRQTVESQEGKRNRKRVTIRAAQPCNEQRDSFIGWAAGNGCVR